MPIHGRNWILLTELYISRYQQEPRQGRQRARNQFGYNFRDVGGGTVVTKERCFLSVGIVWSAASFK